MIQSEHKKNYGIGSSSVLDLEIGVPYLATSEPCPSLAPDHAQTIGNELRRAPTLPDEPERSGGTTLFNYRKQLTNLENRNFQIFRKLALEGLKRQIEGNLKNDDSLRNDGYWYTKKATEYYKCGSWLHPGKVENPAYICCECGHIEPIVQHCKLRICPDCSKTKANEYKHLYEPILAKYHNPRSSLRLRFMTLTVKNQLNFSSEDHNKLSLAFRRFTRYKETKRYLHKGLATFEITHHSEGEPRYSKTGELLGYYDKTNAGWHPHIHIIYSGLYFPNKPEEGRLLTKLWQKACKGLFETQITDVRSLKGTDSLKSALSELIQYTGKQSTLKDPDKAIEYLEMMKGKRLVRMWGFPEKVGRLSKRMICPICDNDSWYFHRGLSNEEILRKQAQERQSLPYYIKRGEVG